jgi:hypothetical protein
LVNQATGRINYTADLIGVRMASINQIIDPYIYILLRKALLFKMLKYLKNLIIRKKKTVTRGKSIQLAMTRPHDLESARSLGNGVSVNSQLNPPLPEINVICENNGDEVESSSDSSAATNASTSSTFKLIQKIKRPSVQTFTQVLQASRRQHKPPLVQRSVSADPRVRVYTESDSDSDGFVENPDHDLERMPPVPPGGAPTNHNRIQQSERAKSGSDRFKSNSNRRVSTEHSDPGPGPMSGRAISAVEDLQIHKRKRRLHSVPTTFENGTSFDNYL